MPTERITVLINEKGAREVRRRIDEIGEASNRATRGIFLFQRALYVLGAAGLVRGLTRQLDVLTNFENRLRLTASSAADAERTQQALFDVARRSRTEFESVAEIYSRAALSLQQLGTSTKETLQFTESLAKASILSGASAREANAALVQLSQGLASNRLSGDELRSVLEQLPFVADVIARSMGITRGELRQFGADGKISAEEVLKAFREAREEIDEKFARTAVTIGQAFSVARTNFQQFLDSFDDATGLSAGIARAIIVISQNIDKLVEGLALLASATFATFAGKAVQSILGYANSIRATITANQAAIASDIQRKASIASVLRARQAAVATTVNELNAERGLIRQRLALASAEANAARFTVQNNIARNVQTGQFVSLTAATARYNAAQTALNITQGRLLVTENALTAARGRLTATTNAATVAAGRYGAAQAASTAGLARFGALGRGLQLIIRGVAAALGTVITLLGGPITAGIALVGALTYAFIRWGNAIEFNVGGQMLGLRDLTVATFQVISERIQSVGELISDNFFSPLLESARSVFGSIFAELDLVPDAFDGAFSSGVGLAIKSIASFPAFVIGTVSGIIGALGAVPDAFGSIWDKAVNIALEIFDFFAREAIKVINSIIGKLNILGGTLAGNALGIPEGGIPELIFKESDKRTVRDGGVGLAAAFGEGFRDGFTATNNFVDSTIGKLGQDIRDRAKLIQARRQPVQGPELPENNQDPIKASSGGGGKTGKDFNSLLDLLTKQIALEKEFGLEKAKNAKILEFEKKLKRDLNETEKSLVQSAVELIEISKIQGQVLEETFAPQERLRLAQEALNELWRQGTINLGQMNDRLREMQAEADRASGTVMGGFRASLSDSILSATEFGEAIGGHVVGAVDGLADAFVEFAKTGELNIRQVFQTLFANLAKLAAQQLLLRLLGSALGIPGGGLGGGGAIGGGGLLGLATGGSIMPSGPGSTDSQVVAFKKRPDERVDVLTPRQQRQQADAMGGGGTTVVQAPAPNVVVQITPDDIANALSGEAGDRMIVRGLERNQNAAKATLGG